ncbi:phospholipid-transporting ATPase ABCA3-like [Echinops telfairi]|uniref:Phospholipid-transporting ATPase ABCA3-like n=1 Tax=Echinops telfairi TaxID=9371 RepID=A0AC55CL99_ECHTE|nr:phospholipid-transporting ATPase ABCA3-like [Echinops telfairi]
MTGDILAVAIWKVSVVFVFWYVEAVFPRDYGVPYPWYFFGKYSYWNEKTTSILRRRRKHLGVKKNSEEFFEPEPENLVASIQIKNLTKLKGLPWDICHNEINNALNFFKLQDKRHSFPNSLSGGMKRKLSVSIALIGNPKVVMLDAPTTGMDSVSKKATWTLLQQQKYGRTILLATPSMDEADLLGDRIAIIVKGNLQCCIGYHMVVVKEPHSKEATQIASLIYNYVPNAILQSHVGSELSFILPKDYANRFSDLFTELKNQQLSLGIASYGASFATMEEVFLRVIQLTDSMVDLQAIQLPTKHDRNKVQRYCSSWDHKSKSESLMSADLSNIQFNTGIVLCIQQFYALLIKRALYTFRHWKIMVLQILILLFFTAFFLKVIFYNSEVKDPPSLGMDLHKYGQSIVPYTFSLDTELGIRFSDHIKLILANEKQLPHPVTGNMEEYLLKSRSCKEQCIVAVSLDVQESKAIFTALFNNQAYHTAPTALNLVNNILFKLLSGPGASISVANKPQPPTASQKLKKQFHKGIKGYDVAFSLFLGTAIVASSFSLLTISERVCKAKHIQFVSGAHMGVFWLSALVWDIIIIFVCSLLLLVVFYICHVDVFFEGNNYTDVLLILVLFGWSIVPFIYLMSFLFSNSATAYTKLLAFNLLTGIASFFLVHMIDTNMMNLGRFNQLLVGLCFLFPTHNLGQSISGLYDNFQAQKYCARSYGDCTGNSIKSKQASYGFEGHGIGKYVIAMIVTGFLFLTLLFIIEVNLLKIRSFFSDFLYGNFLKKRKMAQVGHQSSLESDDESLVHERKRVLKCTPEKLSSLNSPLILKELLKIYFQPVPLVAVDRFTLTVEKGECFGLLGLSGAGKNSIFKMLTGDSIITSGEVIFGDKNIGQVHQGISYCPQHDPLLEHLTGYEMLALHARLWGVPEPCLPAYIKNMLSTLSLGAFEDELIMNFSSGTKRKLSTCIALLGRPDIIFLNKPSSSMDSVAQRFLWDMISRIRESCKAIVIIPYSMEECEALCTRLAFMENGKLKCLGSPQYLKNKFGSRFKLLAKIKRNKALEGLQELKMFIQTTFPESSLMHECQRTVHYHIPSESLTLGKVFDILESIKDKCGLEAYSISHNTLEKVFLNFTQIQTE